MSYWSIASTSRIGRRRALTALGSGAAAAAFLAACGGSDDDEEGSSSGGSSPQEQVKRGGNFRLGASLDLLGTDVHVTGQNRSTLWLIAEGLTTKDEQLKDVPQLAESWELTDGGTTVVLKLRKGVTYHSGREFTSEDVRWNLERVKDPTQPYGQFRQMANWYPNIETPDKYSITLKGTAPRPSTFDFYSTFMMADRDTLGGSTVVGTGPWKWVEWRQGQSMRWDKNPSYWKQGFPYFDQINWQLALDPEAAIAHLEAGAMDAMLSPSVNGYLRLKDNNQFRIITHPNPGSNLAIGFNTLNKPFDDKRVRQAFNWAVDRKRLQDVVLRGTAETRSLPWNKSSAAYEASKDQYYTFDLKKTADLLRAASASNLSTEVTSTRANAMADFLPIYQNDLKSIGVELKLDLVESAAFPPKVNGLQHKSLWASGSGNAGGESISLFVLGSGTWGATGQGSITGFKDDTFQALIEKGATEIDTAKRKQIYSQLNDGLLDLCYTFAVAPSAVRTVAVSKLKGVTATPHDSFYFTDAWFS